MLFTFLSVFAILLSVVLSNVIGPIEQVTWPKAPNNSLTQRSLFFGDCAPVEREYIRGLLVNEVTDLALYASEATHRDNFNRYDRKKCAEYFKTNNYERKEKISRRYRAIAREASRANHGKMAIHCRLDPRSVGAEGCSGSNDDGTPRSSYTISPQNILVLCPPYWWLPKYNRTISANDQVTDLMRGLLLSKDIFIPNTVQFRKTGDSVKEWHLSTDQAGHDTRTHIYFAKALKAREPAPLYKGEQPARPHK